jgi:hypothetical protein
MRRLALIACCLAALGGCAGTPPGSGEPAPWAQAEPAEPAANVDGLLAYFQHVRKMSGGELAREQQAAQRAYDRNRSDYARMRLAIVLTLPGAAPNDQTRALELVAPVARNRQSRLQGMAFMMETYLRELRRIDAEAQGMQQKLEQLKSLERSLIERDEAGRRR